MNVHDSSQTSVFEKAFALAGLLLTGGMLAFFLHTWWTSSDEEPALSVRVLAQQRSGASHLVLFEVENLGGRTAAGVAVEGRLSEGGEWLESARAELDYVPAGSTVEGGLYFQNDPAGLSLEIRALGYTRP